MSYIGKQPSPAVLTASDIIDGIVSNAKPAQDIISADTALGAEPADTDEFLVSDAGTLKRMDYSYIKGGGITQADQWRLTTSITATNADITANLERSDDASFGRIGTGMTESSGIFTFPSTGIYQIILFGTFLVEGTAEVSMELDLYATTNNSTYVKVLNIQQGNQTTSTCFQTASKSCFVDVTDTANVKVKFATGSLSSNSVVLGSTSENRSSFIFIRVGDT